MIAAGGRRPPASEGGWSRLSRWAELSVPTMAEIREFRPLLQPLLLGWVCTGLTAWLTVPLVDVALAGDPGTAAPMVRGWMWAMAALAPLVQGVRASLWATVTWALLTLTAREVPVRTLLSVFLYGELLPTVYGVFLAVFFQWSVEPGATGATFLDPLSVSAYVPSSHGPWGGLVKHLSLIQAVWVAYVGIGARRILGLGSKRAWALAPTLWLGAVAVATAKALLNG